MPYNSRSKTKTNVAPDTNDTSPIYSKSKSPKAKKSVKRGVDNITREQCQKWADSLNAVSNDKYSKNTLTNANIKLNGPLHNQIAEKCKEYGIEFQKVLNLKEFLDNVKDISELEEWIKYPSYNPLDSIVFEHAACLTSEEKATEQGAATDRQPIFYDTLVEDIMDCQIEGGLFSEYIIFESFEQSLPWKKYLRYLSTAKLYRDEYADKIHPYYLNSSLSGLDILDHS